MGVKITELMHPKTIEFSDLYNKVLVVDAFNMLYQFITTIRQPDGSPLTDNSGNITSHLAGLFYRITNLMKMGMKLAFVFDGKSHVLKFKEQERRAKIKSEAKKKYDEAVESEDIDQMKKYASRTAKLTTEMIQESKELLDALGIPVVQAPGEGEAQAAHMVKKGDAFAVVSQDADSLLFGAERIVKNLSISKKRKKTGKLGYDKVLPELIKYKEVLETLNLDNEQLIILGILVGTDFNIGGIKGIGPKKAIKLVKEKKGKWNELFQESGWDFSYDWKEVYNIFNQPDITKEYTLSWKDIDEQKVKKIMVADHDFSQERVNSVLKDLLSIKEKEQKGLSDFF